MNKSYIINKTLEIGGKYEYDDEVRDTVISEGNSKDITVTNCLFQNTKGCIYASPSGAATLAKNYFYNSYQAAVVHIQSNSLIEFTSNCILRCQGQGKGNDGDGYGSMNLLKSKEIVGYSFNLVYGCKSASASQWLEYLISNSITASSSNHTLNEANTCSGPLIKAIEDGSLKMLWMDNCSSDMQLEIYESPNTVYLSQIIFSRGKPVKLEYGDLMFYDCNTSEASDCTFFQSQRISDIFMRSIVSAKFLSCTFSRSSPMVMGENSQEATFENSLVSIQIISLDGFYAPQKCSVARKEHFKYNPLRIFMHIATIVDNEIITSKN